jgi:LPXTG-motif cell wall-anchored protein
MTMGPDGSLSIRLGAAFIIADLLLDGRDDWAFAVIGIVSILAGFYLNYKKKKENPKV